MPKEATADEKKKAKQNVKEIELKLSQEFKIKKYHEEDHGILKVKVRMNSVLFSMRIKECVSELISGSVKEVEKLLLE